MLLASMLITLGVPFTFVCALAHYVIIHQHVTKRREACAVYRLYAAVHADTLYCNLESVEMTVIP